MNHLFATKKLDRQDPSRKSSTFPRAGTAAARRALFEGSSGSTEAISRDGNNEWDSRRNLIDDPASKQLSPTQQSPNQLSPRQHSPIQKSPLQERRVQQQLQPEQEASVVPAREKFRKLSEGKGLVGRGRRETGAPLTGKASGTDSGIGFCSSGGGSESNGNSGDEMDDDDDDDDYDEEDEDSSEDSRRNKPPIPRKPANLAKKVSGSGSKSPGSGRSSPNSGTTSPSASRTTPNGSRTAPHKPPLTSAKSAGSPAIVTSSPVETRRANNLSEDQRTYDQVCYEDNCQLVPNQPSKKNLEKFLGMKPDMAHTIKSIKPCSELTVSGGSTGSTDGGKGFLMFMKRRKSENRDDSTHESSSDPKEKHYAVVDIPGSERTPKKDQKPKSSAARLLQESDSNNFSDHDSSKTSGDSGISVTISPRRPNGPHVPSDFKDSVGKTGSMDSDFIEGDSSDDDAPDSDFEQSDHESEVKERPTENISFINQSHKVAYEVLTSERQYVDRLHLLHKVFEHKIRSENDKHNWFPKDVVNIIFSNLKSIYELHHGFLLKQLEARMKEWESKPCLGDIMATVSPFLKLYTDYVGNFDNAVKCLNMWMSKERKFASLLQDIQKKPICVHLTLQHHMLEPVQRIPRYELLLKEYLKKLPAESSDRTDAQRALDLISKAAQHSNNMMMTMENFQKLLKLNEKIDGSKIIDPGSIIDPSRRLLKEGKIGRVSARSGDVLDRYLFLFNDMLLCCTQKRQLTGSVSYKVKDKVDIDEVKLLDGLQTRFRLERSPKSLEFETTTDEQKEEWMSVLLEAIKEMVRKKESFKASITTSEKDDDYCLPLGERAPSFIRDEETTMCMKCGLEFNFTRRRHHCRACGAVVCGKCSNFNDPLPYDDNKVNRVCGPCHNTLTGKEDAIEKRKSFVDIDKSKSYSSFLWYLQPKGQTWARYWVAATEQDLFALRAPKDVRAFLTVPIKLYQVSEVESSDSVDREYAFKLTSHDNTFFFAAENKETKYNWMLVFTDGLSSVLNASSNGTRDSTQL